MADAALIARGRNLAIILVAGAALTACATPKPTYSVRGPSAGPAPAAPNGAGGRYKVGAPYQVAGVWYVPKEDPTYDQTGLASWYGDEFHMKTTANGELFDMTMPSAAHTTLPLPSIVEVTNLDNGRKIQVRVNDRGPFVGGRIIDLSREGARQLGFERAGTANVRVRYVGPAPLGPPDRSLRQASYTPTPVPPAELPRSPIPYEGLTAPAPVAVASSPLTPIAVSTAPAPIPAASTGGAYRVQAGAFSDHGRARAVADQVSIAGHAVIEPVQRADGLTLYRVLVTGGADEASAWTTRDQVAALGFADARVIRP
ncbi:MAG: septal ring lytic transglycosylase RlpA family protein [Phenylobacterium sp.]|uniref:septal ring lytic transglycosylase RlpA family protein n=1 Tax=Phenylobacterium sp. TaxID=1871053 RepID=UPI00391B271D